MLQIQDDFFECFEHRRAKAAPREAEGGAKRGSRRTSATNIDVKRPEIVPELFLAAGCVAEIVGTKKMQMSNMPWGLAQAKK